MSMAAPQVTLQSITGVDVELRIAGAGSRSYAFVIDWHIRFVLALAWLIVASLAYAGRVSIFAADVADSWDQGYVLAVLLPMGIIYFGYHPILEIVMRGSTPGKRMAGVRIVTRTGDIPGPGALLLRNVFRLIDSMPMVYLVGLLTVMFTAQHVRIGDLAAGTLLIIDRDESEHSFARLAPTRGLDPQAADLIHELLERWNALDDKTRGNIARSLIVRVDQNASATELEALSTFDLRERLKKLLNPEPAT
jgi:uncharacterized RDD family membrane protein YckC